MIRKITLTDHEFQALAGLLDAGLRATGIRAVKDAAAILDRMEAAEELPEVPVGEPPCED